MSKTKFDNLSQAILPKALERVGRAGSEGVCERGWGGDDGGGARNEKL